MLHSQWSLVFNRPIEDVFAFLSRPEQLVGPEQYREAHLIGGGVLRAGTSILYTGKGPLRWMKSRVEITRYDPPHHLAFREEASGCISGTATYRYDLKAVAEVTRVTLTMEGTYRGWARLFYLLFHRPFAGLLEQQAQMRLIMLKNKLETPPTEEQAPHLDIQLAGPQAETEIIGVGTRGTRKRPLLSLLSQMQPLDLIRQPDGSTRWRAAFITLYLLMALVLFGFTIKDFWGDWQDGQWEPFSFYQLGLTWLALIGIWTWNRLGDRGGKRALAAQAVRQFAAAGNERVAPLATTQPSTQPNTLSLQSVLGLRLKRPVDSSQLVSQILPLALVVLALGGTIFLGGFFGPLVTIAASALLALVILGGVVLFWRWHQPLIVQADDLGIRWAAWHWWGSREQMIAWSQARAFFTFTFQSTTLFSSPHSVYALESPTAILAWEGPPHAKREQSEAHDYLCSLIVRHTSLPLRDVSDCLGTSLQPGFRAMLTYSQRFADLSVPVPRHARRHWALLIVWLVPLLLVGIDYGASWGLSRYERSYYGNLLAQVERHQPLYHNTLAAPDGDWPIHTPTADDNTSYTYSNGMYQLSGGPDGDSTTVWPQQIVSYGDAAVEVTARMLKGSQYDSVGLMLHSNGNGAMFVFSITPSGFWEIEHDDLGGRVLASISDRADSGLIHSSLGADNRLAVIMRGDQYICFINGQFVGILHDSGRPTGLVGLYVGSTAVTAAFSDFIIYPV